MIIRETSISSNILPSSVANMISSVASTSEFCQQLLLSDWSPLCESIIEPMSGIHGLIRRCTDAIGLGTSLVSYRKKGGILYSVHCTLYSVFAVHLKAEQLISLSSIDLLLIG